MCVNTDACSLKATRTTAFEDLGEAPLPALPTSVGARDCAGMAAAPGEERQNPMTSGAACSWRWEGSPAEGGPGNNIPLPHGAFRQAECWAHAVVFKLD